MHKLSIPPQWLNKALNIGVVGCGGTGSEMVDELFRIHTLLVKLGGDGLRVSAYDPDLVSAANVGRQRYWPADIGFQKSEVLISRLNSFGGVNWGYYNKAFEASDSNNFDVIITCVDTPKIRAEIGEYHKAQNSYSDSYRLWIDCGNDSHSGNVILGHLGCSENYIPNVYDLYPILSNMPENNEPSCSTEEALQRQDYGINRSIAREAANLLWLLLRHGSVSHHGSYIDIREGKVTPLPIDPKQWALYGYQKVREQS